MFKKFSYIQHLCTAYKNTKFTKTSSVFVSYFKSLILQFNEQEIIIQ